MEHNIMTVILYDWCFHFIKKYYSYDQYIIVIIKQLVMLLVLDSEIEAES